MLSDRGLTVLEVLIEVKGELVSKDDLMHRVWAGAVVEDNTLEAQISAVRKALGPQRQLLQTSYGRGYRLLGAWHQKAASQAPSLAPIVRASQLRLPLPGSELIGRAGPLRDVCELIKLHRLVTLTGLGGIGKTRLALEVAHEVLERFGGQVYLVELAGLANPDLVASAVATALDLEMGGAAPLPVSVARAIDERSILLVLDNCEHVIDAVAKLVEAIGRNCPAAHILATSREDLRVDGEQVFQVMPLEAPAVEPRLPEEVLKHSAVQLFLRRMKGHKSDFSPSQDELMAMAAVCRRLDGIPLALEFAAARAATLGLAEVLERLDDRFGLLTGGHRSALPRHQALRATLDWSFDLLSKAERRLLRRLGVMVGGFSLDAVRALADDDTTDVVEDLAQLVAKALVVLSEGGAAGRWSLLETVRTYALEKLVESGEATLAARRHAEFHCAMFVPRDGGPRLTARLDRLAIYAREIDNVRAAMAWALSDRGDAQIGVELTAAYLPYLLHRSMLAECRQWGELAVARLGPSVHLGASLRAQLYITLGLAMIYTDGQAERTREVLLEGLKISAGHDDVELMLQALWALLIDHFNNRFHREAQAYAERFSALAATTGDSADLHMGWRVMGTTNHYAGQQQEARRFFESYVAGYAPPRGERHFTWLHYDGPVLVRARLARVLWLQGLADQATDLASANIAGARLSGHKLSVCLAIGEAACPIAIMIGDFTKAEEQLAELVEIATKQSYSSWIRMARCLEGKLLVQRGETTRGVAVLREAIGSFGAAQQSLHYFGFVSDLVEALAAEGAMNEAEATLEQALLRSEQSGVKWHVAELLRVRGQLRLSRDGNVGANHARHDFEAAIELARDQGAFLWELRAALSLARLDTAHGRASQARSLLRGVSDRVTEGFGTVDVQAAQHLLAELSESPSNS